jgi:hypothetical protein
MSGYSCSDCREGELVVKTREVELEEGETASVLDSGVIVASKIECSNEECISHATAEAEDPDAGEECGHNGCARQKGHTGNHRKATKAKD